MKTKRIPVAVGDRYGRLTIIKEVEPHHDPCGRIKRQFFCQCDCGDRLVVLLTSLRTGATKSCGCLQKEAVSAANTKHGYCNTQIYHSWNTMIQRCCNPKNKKYPQYGGRGIAVRQGWKESFEAFLEDMGPPPSPEHSIDRIDNSSGYRKDNCRWASRKEQASNTRKNVFLTHQAQTLCLAEWAERVGLNRDTLRSRIRLWWSAEKILTTPPDKRLSRIP